MIPAELRVVAEKLKRFDVCAEDSDSGGCDIGRAWFDVLTTIGLLRRVQRSPALWEMTEAGQSLMDLIDRQPATAAPDIEQPRDPIIPADKWPEWADRHCWDEDGSGWFHGTSVDHASAEWVPDYIGSRIPLPDGHNWRVPVMRPTVKESLAVDLGQFRDAFTLIDEDGIDEEEHHCAWVIAEERKRLHRLLDMVDGQNGVGNE